MAKPCLSGAFALSLLLSGAGETPSNVDVLIAGGTEAAVEAAIAAKAAGKSVLLVSPRPYLGEDTAGRFELEPRQAEDEQISSRKDFDYAADGSKARIDVNFETPEEITRLELVTWESRHAKKNPVGTRECHFVYVGADGKKHFDPIPFRLAMNYSPGGRYVWRAELDKKVRLLAVALTRDEGMAKVAVDELRIFRKCPAGTLRRPTPLEAKSALDERLASAGVPFLTGGMGVDVLFDSSRRVSGAVFATRGGLKTVRAKCTVDASVHGVLLKAAGGALKPLPETVRLSRVVLSGEKPSAPGLAVEEMDYERTGWFQSRGAGPRKATGRLYRCSFDWKTDDTPRGWAAADMKARELVWTAKQLDAADELAIPVRTCAKAVPGLVYLPVGAKPPAAFETPEPKGKVARAKRKARVLATCDVCVVGAGTAGAPATIAAARAGAKTVAVEYMYGLGGLGTMGMIGYYWYGTVCGFTEEVEKGLDALGALVRGVGKREWWRREAMKAGAEVFFGSMGYDVVMDGNRIVGVAVATPYGCGVIRTSVAVDATGAADLAFKAKERTEFVGADELAMQSAGLPPRLPGFTYVNSDFGFVNDNDIADATLFSLRGRRGAKGEWDVSQILGTRERRRMLADFQVQAEDVLNERTFPDTIATGSTDFDTHGPTVADVCFLSPATDKHVFKLNIPYRALLPAKTDGLLVCGIGASGQRDAMPFMRMQADVQNEGYAAGRAAAMSAKSGKPPRAIDVKELQRHLAEIGSIPKAALGWRDNFPLSEAEWSAAIAAVGDGFRGAPLVLTDKPRAKRDLVAAYAKESDPKRRLCIAQVLGMLGDATGAEALAENLSRPVKDFVQVVPETAKRFGKRMTNRDAQLVALGRSRSPLAPEIVRKEIRTLKATDTQRRIRAVALAASALADPSLAPELARALGREGMGGHSCASAANLGPLAGFTRMPGSQESAACQKELALARALYVCGDFDGLGKRTLEAYAADPRKVYAAHAKAVLEAVKPACAEGKVGLLEGSAASGMCGAKVARRGAAIDVRVKPEEPWSGVMLRLPWVLDLTRVGRLTALVSNRTDRPLALLMHAKNPGEADRFLQGRVNLSAHAVGRVFVSAQAMATRFTTLDLPGVRGYEKDAKEVSPDPARIGVVNLFRLREREEAAFTLLSLTTEGEGESLPRLAEDESFFPFVDRFGQFVHADWPGKAKDEDDLVRAGAAEKAFLAENGRSPIPGADRFGGWAEGPQLKATGFFRTEKVNGKWWFVDPDGHLFFSQGVNAVFYPEMTGTTGREKFFAWLPERDDACFAGCWGRRTTATVRGYYATHFPCDLFSFFAANQARKYGGDWWRKTFPDLVHRRMKAWGLNTIGNWSAPEVTALARTPYTDHFETRARPIRGNAGYWRKFPDVFAPEFKANAEADAAALAKRSGTDPWCLGWFVDNELSWGKDDRTLAREVLASSDDQPAKVEFLRILGKKGIDPKSVPDDELVALTRHFADRYFSVVREAIRKAAPDRLYLGCRFSWNCSVPWRSAAAHCDVVSANIYRDLPETPFAKDAAEKPLLIGEFHFGALDRGLLHAGLCPVRNQRSRAEAYKRYVRAAFASRQIVGAHWFLWADQPLAGRFDGECFQSGLVDVTDNPYPEMVAAMRELAGEIYGER